MRPASPNTYFDPSPVTRSGLGYSFPRPQVRPARLLWRPKAGGCSPRPVAGMERHFLRCSSLRAQLFPRRLILIVPGLPMLVVHSLPLVVPGGRRPVGFWPPPRASSPCLRCRCLGRGMQPFSHGWKNRPGAPSARPWMPSTTLRIRILPAMPMRGHMRLEKWSRGYSDAGRSGRTIAGLMSATFR